MSDNSDILNLDNFRTDDQMPSFGLFQGETQARNGHRKHQIYCKKMAATSVNKGPTVLVGDTTLAVGSLTPKLSLPMGPQPLPNTMSRGPHYYIGEMVSHFIQWL